MPPSSAEAVTVCTPVAISGSGAGSGLASGSARRGGRSKERPGRGRGSRVRSRPLRVLDLRESNVSRFGRSDRSGISRRPGRASPRFRPRVHTGPPHILARSLRTPRLARLRLARTALPCPRAPLSTFVSWAPLQIAMCAIPGHREMLALHRERDRMPAPSCHPSSNGPRCRAPDRPCTFCRWCSTRRPSAASVPSPSAEQSESVSPP